jgi:hypothetical protein
LESPFLVRFCPNDIVHPRGLRIDAQVGRAVFWTTKTGAKS